MRNEKSHKDGEIRILFKLKISFLIGADWLKQGKHVSSD